jgi:hypothetical protein
MAVTAAGFAVVSYICLARTRYVQSLALRWRNLQEPSWELRFLNSAAYLWMVRFVGIIAMVNALIIVWIAVRIATR